MLIAVAGAILTSTTVWAQSISTEPAAEQAPTAETNLVESAPVRDPFWPVGYEKPKPKPKIEEVKQKEQTSKDKVVWPKIVVKGFVKVRGGYSALLEEHGIVSEDDTIKIKRDGWLYRIKIDTITDSDLSYRKVDATPPGEKPIVFSPQDKVKETKSKP